jgi:hypothetical protein
MSLRKRFAKKDSPTLVEILESPEGYTPEAMEVAKEELFSRELDETTIHKMAVNYNTERIKNLLEKFDPLNDKLEVPKSFFLSHKIMRSMLKSEFKEFIDQKDGFRFDVMQYAMGGL